MAKVDLVSTIEALPNDVQFNFNRAIMRYVLTGEEPQSECVNGKLWECVKSSIISNILSGIEGINDDWGEGINFLFKEPLK